MSRYFYLKQRADNLEISDIPLLIQSFEQSFDCSASSESLSFEDWYLEQMRKKETLDSIIPMIFEDNDMQPSSALNNESTNIEDTFYDSVDYGDASIPNKLNGISAKPIIQKKLNDFVVSRYAWYTPQSSISEYNKQKKGLILLLAEKKFDQNLLIKSLDRASTQIALSHQ